MTQKAFYDWLDILRMVESHPALAETLPEEIRLKLKEFEP